MNSAFNNQLQRASLKMTNGTTELQSVAYGYDTAGRLETVTEGNYSASYAYHANSPLIDTVTFKNGQDTRLVTTRRYDRLNRLESISSAAYGSGATNLPISYAYQYNRANQRTRVGLADGAYWVYQYDALGQVISGKKYWSDGTPVAGQQFEYGFDYIGNRLSTKAGGDENGGALRSATYTANRLNQYTQRTNSGGFDVLGIANVGATIQVNSSTNGMYRRGEYFRKELFVDNSAAVWQGVTNTATLGQDQATETGNVFVPPTPEVFGHDADGNLTNDGRWAYVWDAENRLVRMVSRTGTPTNSWRALDFGYDYQGRRISKTVSNWNGVAWVKTTDIRFVYDGWNLQAVLDAQSSILQSFVWGLDLSGSLQGAGGVGGLLKISDAQSPSGDYFPTYDGNGNVTALLDASDGGLMANYEYGPFGELIRANGPMAKANPFRFSTKYQDDETDLLYYGYRYYSASTGRWLSRDPIGENGGANVYEFVANDAIQFADVLGLYGNPVPPCAPYPECLNKPPSKGSWSLSLPDFQFTTGQSVQFKGCWPIGGPISVCLAGGWTLRVGNCCKHGEKKGYFRMQGNVTVTFEVGISKPFSISYTKPFVENLARCPDEGGNLAWHMVFSIRVGPAVGQCRYSRRVIGGDDGGRWVCSGSLSFTSWSGVNVSGGGGAAGSYTKLLEPQW